VNLVQHLIENRRRQKELVVQHQEIGRKFNAFAAPLRTQCDAKLKREAFAPFMAVERGHERAQKAQTDIISQLRALEVAQTALLTRLDAEGNSAAAVSPPVESTPPPPAPVLVPVLDDDDEPALDENIVEEFDL
jgi:hypothetical protein